MMEKKYNINGTIYIVEIHEKRNIINCIHFSKKRYIKKYNYVIKMITTNDIIIITIKNYIHEVIEFLHKLRGGNNENSFI